MYGCESWAVRKADRKKNGLIGNMVMEESSVDTLDCQKDEQVGPEQIKNDKTEAVLLGAHHEKAGVFGNDSDAGKSRCSRKRGRANMRWMSP